MIAFAPLRRFTRLVNGGTPRADPVYWGGTVSWATPIDLARFDGGYIGDTERTLSPLGLRQGSATVPRGSIIISTRAPIGYAAVTSREMAFNQGCRGLIPFESVDARFIRYWLSVRRSDLQAAGLGSTFTELSSDALMQFPVPDRPRSAQVQIADFLDEQTGRIDAIVSACKERAIRFSELKRNLADSVLSDITVSTRRLAGLLKLAAVGVVVNPSSYFVEHGVPFVHGFNVREGYLDLANLKYLSRVDSNKLQRSRLQAGDVLVVRAGYPGRAAVVPESLAGGNCASVLILRPNSKLDSAWLETFFNSTLGKREVELVQYGAAQGVINLGDVRNFRIPLPSVDAQRAQLSDLARDRSAIDKAQDLTARLADRMGGLRQSLIAAAVTGEFDVSSADGSQVPVP